MDSELYLVLGAAVAVMIFLFLKAIGARRGAIAAYNRRAASPGDGDSINAEIDGQEYDIDPVTMAEVRNLTDKGNKIEAIKRLRETTGLGLHEAKQIVEALERLRTK